MRWLALALVLLVTPAWADEAPEELSPDEHTEGVPAGPPIVDISTLPQWHGWVRQPTGRVTPITLRSETQQKARDELNDDYCGQQLGTRDCLVRGPFAGPYVREITKPPHQRMAQQVRSRRAGYREGRGQSHGSGPSCR